LKIDGFNSQVVGVYIYNAAGRKVSEVKLAHSFDTSIDLSALENGIYLLSFRLEDGQVMNKKIVKS